MYGVKKMTVEASNRPVEPQASASLLRRTISTGVFVGSLFSLGTVVGLATEGLEYEESTAAIADIQACAGDQDSFGGQLVIDLQQSDVSPEQRGSCIRMLDARRDQRELVSRYVINLEAVEERRQQLEADKPFRLNEKPKQWGLGICAGGTALWLLITGQEKLTSRKKSKVLDSKH